MAKTAMVVLLHMMLKRRIKITIMWHEFSFKGKQYLRLGLCTVSKNGASFEAAVNDDMMPTKRCGMAHFDGFFLPRGEC
jgi:hypothetical protein